VKSDLYLHVDLNSQVVYNTGLIVNKYCYIIKEGVQVRLVGGAHSTEGRVEVFHGGQWGSVCDSDWDDSDATVICRMLAYFPYDRCDHHFYFFM
jgi:hypothetical protein